MNTVSLSSPQVTTLRRTSGVLAASRARGHIRSLWGYPQKTCQPISACGCDTGPSRTEEGTGRGAGLYRSGRWRRCKPRPKCNGSATACSCKTGPLSSAARRWGRPWTRARGRGCAPVGSWTWRGTACWSPRSSCRASHRSRRKLHRRPSAGGPSGLGPPGYASRPRCL